MLVNVIYTPIWEKCILRTSSHEHQCPSLTGFSNKWFFFMLFIQIGHWDFIGVTMGESHIYMDKTLHTGKQEAQMKHEDNSIYFCVKILSQFWLLSESGILKLWNSKLPHGSF